MNNLKIKLLFLLLVGLIVLGVWAVSRREPPAVAPPMVHTTYLPIIYMKPRPALLGVGQPWQAAACTDLDKLGPAWYYNWTPFTACDGSNFVPMIGWESRMPDLQAAIANAQNGYGWLLGFNEPNEPGQADLSPERAALLWRTIENAAIPAGVKLVSPAPSSVNPEWLTYMVEAYEAEYGEKPHFDAIGVHYYSFYWPPECEDPATPAKAYITARRAQALSLGYDVPLWITEWAACCYLDNPSSGNAKMMSDLIPWMRSKPWITHFAWFGLRIRPIEPYCTWCEHCSLIDSETGDINGLGEHYRSFR